MATGLRRIDNATRAVKVLDFRYPYVLYYYDVSGNLEYMCEHHTHGTATSDDEWVVTKFTYGANGITVSETLTGVCDDRASLGWV